eukprot:TRINITY_DN40241_c0_g1_i1.p1 TRINITY_DN40241_c0_g1~~TRINITY_DN40241_c0_g1_i1.p1  ORF type:complete len:747 (-),score=105.54 TRINITY_DN40241_c0_g1_i1:34-2094(-)
MAVIAQQLQCQGYAVVDQFLSIEEARSLRSEVESAHSANQLVPGGLINGRVVSADDSKYESTVTRGDLIGWFDPDDKGWPYGRTLDSFLVKVGTLSSELAGAGVKECSKITARAKPMVACYPGGGAHYVKHVDNDGKHELCKRRIMTALVYLNSSWKHGDGGELVIFDSEDTDVERRVVEPLSNRLVIFWSDCRTPHMVRPARVPRYSVTLWLLGGESTEAIAADGGDNVVAADARDQSSAIADVTQTQAGASPSPVKTVETSSSASTSQAVLSAAAAPTPAVPAETATAARLPTVVKPATEMARQPTAVSITCESRTTEADLQASTALRYWWLELSSEDETSWELNVQMHCEPFTCPAIEMSGSQIRVVGASGGTGCGGDLLLCLPVPSRTAVSSKPPKWSKRRGVLTVRFDPAPAITVGLGPKTDASDYIDVVACDLSRQLQARGWGVVDAFLTCPEADDLRRYVFKQRVAGRLRCGGNNHEGPTGARRPDGQLSTKNDEYAFVDDLVAADAAVAAAVEPLRICARRLNRLVASMLRSGDVTDLKEVKVTQGRPMVAVYPGDGARYGRHYDASTTVAGGDNGRVLTTLVYLNPFWRDQHGGQLRLLPEGNGAAGCTSVDSQPVDLEPLHGRLVVFLAKNRCPHEVLPAWADRAAVTFWYYDGSRLTERCRSDAEITGFGFESAD